MDSDSNQCVLRLISFLETLLASTHLNRIVIETLSSEAQKLLHGWKLPENEGDTTCRCVESQKHQLTSFIEKIQKAVKYSQSVREGRNDVDNPWPEEAEVGHCPSKINTTKGFLHSKSAGENNKEKLMKTKIANRSSKKLSPVIGSQMKVLEQSYNTCPLHGNSISADNNHEVKSHQTVGLAEALDVKGIPPELVTILKSVHHYINRMRTTSLKNRTESLFLRNLTTVNEHKWKSCAPHGLLSKLSSWKFNGLQRPIPMMEGKGDFESSKSQLILQDSFLVPGMWNPLISKILSVDALCIQYQNEEIWHLLQMRIQQLQLTHAEWQVCDILSCDKLISNPELLLSSGPLLLKAASALSRLTALNLPVLVKTSEGQ